MLPLRLAIRYIFSRKSSSIVNLIAVVSAVALSLTVAAALFIISLQYGLEKFVIGMYASIDPPFRIVRTDGSMFDRRIMDGADIGLAAPRKDMNVLLECGSKQTSVVLSGVDTVFCKVTGIDGLLSSGRNPIPEMSFGMLLGRGTAYELGIASGMVKTVKVSSIKKHGGFFSNVPLLKSCDLLPVGVYSLDQETDSRYAFTPIDRLDFLSMDSLSVSSLEVLPKEGIGKEDLQKLLPEGFCVLDRFDMRASLFNMVHREKWVIFLLLVLIAMLASLSLAGTVSVMRREKDTDIAVLTVLGYTLSKVRTTFFMLGLAITVASVAVGTVAGLLLVAVQNIFGILKLGGSTFLIDSYPVAIDPLMWLVTVSASVLTGALVAFAAACSDRLKP